MTRPTWEDIKAKKLSKMTAKERHEFEHGYSEAQRAAEEHDQPPCMVRTPPEPDVVSGSR